MSANQYDLLKEWLQSDKPQLEDPAGYLHWLEAELRKIRQADADPESWHGHVACVRQSDLEDYFQEDAQYFNPEMLAALADSIWDSDDDGWLEMFDHNLRAAVMDNWDEWQKEIDEEKKRRRDGSPNPRP